MNTKEKDIVSYCKKILSKNNKINFNNGEYAICCDIFTNKIEFYYIDSDSILKDIVIGYCDNLDDVNSVIEELSNKYRKIESTKSLTEKELKMDVWEWGDVKGTDEELCNHIAEYAEEKGIEYMEITEDEFEYLKKDYLKKYKSMKEGIQKKDWESWKIDSIGGTVFEYYFNGHNEKENIIQSLIEDDYPTIKVDYGEILGALNKEFRGKTLGDMQKKGYVLPWGKDVDLGIHFNYQIEKLNSVSNGNSGMVELHCDFYIPSTDEIYNFGCHAFVYVDDLNVSMFLESKKSAKKSLKESFDDGDQIVIDVVDMLILDFGYDKKTVEKYFYKIHKLNDFDTISIDEYIKIKEEIEKALGYDDIF